MTKGRKRKPGRRTRSGRLSRAKMPQASYDRGTPRAQAQRAIYGTDCSDAIGRAYRAGLLGEEDEAKPRLDTARALSAAYWASYTVGPCRSLLDTAPRGTGASIDHERAHRREKWLSEQLSNIDALGRTFRRAFDQLAIDIHPDEGPRWLDRLIAARLAAKSPQIADMHTLARAIVALDLIAGLDKRPKM